VKDRNILVINEELKRRRIFYVDFANNNITLLMPFSIENLAEI
jgi:hypothetical protein